MAENKLKSVSVISPHYNYVRSSNGYGGDCSDFMLTTYDESGDPISLYGLLSELPSFSMNIKINDGPGMTIAEKVSKFYCNDIMSIVNAIGAVNSADNSTGFKNLVSTGALTKRIYDGVDYSGLDLKFKIYTAHSPAITPVNRWITMLSKYATIDEDNNTTGTNFNNNIIAAGNTIKTYGAEISRINIKNERKKESTKTEYENSIATIQGKKSEIDEKLSSIVYELSKSTSPYNGIIAGLSLDEAIDDHKETVEYCLHITFSKKDDVGAWWHVTPGKKYSLCDDGNVEWDENNDKARVFAYSKNPTDKDYESGPVNNFAQFFGSATNNCIIKCLETYYKNYLSKNSKYTDKTARTDFLNTDNQLATVLGELCKLLDIPEDDTDLIRNKFREKDLIKFVKDTGEEATRRYGPDRVARTFNKKNALGAKLWNLRIFPWLFQTSIPVYIKSWSYKPSKELGAFTEFNISCYFDQVYSRDMWKFYFTGIPDKT